jgi:ABC-type transport system involved in multi-copper enzyme maturation permease subunit
MPAAILIRFVLLEARRGGLPWLAAATLLAAVVLAAFVSQLALTESRELQAALAAALLRACAVFIVAAHVAASVVREMNDKALELMLSLPLSRSAQYLGRYAGHAAAGAALAAAFALTLLLWAPPGAVALWGVSLALECALVAAAALFFAMTLAQVVPAIGATLGLYLLARSIGAMQAIAAGPLAEPSAAASIARGAVDGLALILPALDRATRTEWLLYGPPPPGACAAALGALVLYAALLVAAGLFDFHRKSV